MVMQGVDVVHLRINCVFFIDQCHEDENSDDFEEVTCSFSPPSPPLTSSQEIKYNHEAVFQETKPRLKRRHSYGNYGSESEVLEPNLKKIRIFF